MWQLRRRDSRGADTTAVGDQPRQGIERTFEELQAEIDELSATNAQRPSRETERRLLRLRHWAGIRLAAVAPADPDFVAAGHDCLSRGEPLPEVPAARLAARVLRAGILGHGCLLVRGLVNRDRARALAGEIDRAFVQRIRAQAGRRATPGYYEEFQPDSRYGVVVGRGWIEQGGGLLAADSPIVAFTLMQMFAGAGLSTIVSDYLGEPALLSVHKTTLRKAEPWVPGAWHQDGKFMGPVRSLNLWLSLSRCGDRAPGLDIVPRRLDHLVTAATEEAPLDYVVSQKKATEAAGDRPIVRPIFEPGDALFFDELFLHKTGSDPSMPDPRYAVESWFFGGSAFPDEYAPLAV